MTLMKRSRAVCMKLFTLVSSVTLPQLKTGFENVSALLKRTIEKVRSIIGNSDVTSASLACSRIDQVGMEDQQHNFFGRIIAHALMSF